MTHVLAAANGTHARLVFPRESPVSSGGAISVLSGSTRTWGIFSGPSGNERVGFPWEYHVASDGAMPAPGGRTST